MTSTGLNIVNVDGLRFVSRGSHDNEVYREVVKARCYERPRLGFTVRSGERWLDCGANVGAFAVWAEKTKDAKVIAYEACHENTEIASQNLRMNGCCSTIETAFISPRAGGVSSVSFNERTPARSSAMSKGMQRFVKNKSLTEEILKHRPHGLKIDIEGGELPILDAGFPLDGIRALAIEYHFRFEKDCVAARRRIAPFLSHFKHNSIPKTIFTKDRWPAWQDAILLFWS